LWWSLNGSSWTNANLPYDKSPGIAANGSSDSLTLAASCNDIQNASPATVTMTDSLGNTYTLTLVSN
jgi:hypothetical protein